MSGIVSEFARVNDAFSRPALSLLEYKWAPLTVSVLRLSFSHDRTRVPADRLHHQVDTFMEELVLSGHPVPSEKGRELCLTWMQRQWLLRTSALDGEEYSLTSHALEALEIVTSMGKERALLSESRLATILAAARRGALEASPDIERRVTILDAQIAELTEQRTRISAGLEAPVSDDRVMDALASLQDLLDQIPSDFKRVEEAMSGMHRTLLDRFRDGDSNVGEVVSDHLESATNLLQSTPEGRAFTGAQELLRDEDMLGELRDNLSILLEHSAASALSTSERRELQSAVSAIQDGKNSVLSTRHRLTKTLKDHIISHSKAPNRELESVFRAIDRDLHIWMETARPRDRLPVQLLPSPLEIETLKTRFWDPVANASPPPLEDTSHEAPPPVDWETFRQLGGPTMPKLRELLDTTAATSLGEAFDSLPLDMRRPVEVVGLLQVATDQDRYHREQDLEEYVAVRPDGVTVPFTLPKIAIDNDTEQLS